MPDNSQNNKRTSANIRIFLACFFVAFLMWFIVQIAKNYTTPIQIIIDYDKLTSNKIITNKHKDTLEILVETSGFQYFRYTYNKPIIGIDINSVLQTKGQKQFWLPNKNLSKIKDELNVKRVINSNQDTINLSIESRVFKTVPIQNNITFNHSSNYIVKDIKLSQNSIEISGPKGILDTIKEIQTIIKRINIKDNQNPINIYLEFPKNIKANIDYITLTPIIDKLTEKKYEIPITIINAPKKTKIKSIPQKVTVTINVAFSDYDKITEDDIKILCNANNQSNTVEYLPLQVEVQKKFKGDLSLSNSKVQLIIVDL